MDTQVNKKFETWFKERLPEGVFPGANMIVANMAFKDLLLEAFQAGENSN